LSGDGRRVGNRVNHVLTTITSVNDTENCLKPDFQVTLSLTVGKESRELLGLAFQGVNEELAKLKKGLIKDGARYKYFEEGDKIQI
jgi:hypothetical protein